MKTFAHYYGMNSEDHFVFIPEDSEAFKKMLKLSGLVSFENWKERDVIKHRKYFALINATIYHTNESFTQRFGSTDKMRKQLMILSGNCETFENANGTIGYEAHSIKFKNMDQHKFDVIYKDCLDAAVHFMLSDISYEDFKNDIMNFI